MARVFISVGSNIDRKKHITAGIRALHELYHPIKCSSVYESESVGFDGDNFYNLVIELDTQSSITEVSANLANIEDLNGRNRQGPRFSSRTLDLDLLLYGDQVLNSSTLTLPRPEIYENAFVLLPLTELAGQQKDPLSEHTYAQLWNKFDQQKQQLWAIDFDTDFCSAHL
ncbi:MAG: 2-amino-4-hydroxy-6-hydroxymethyldihydropteridine diphosphokinase [Gammaproteobacteria bacterium]|nr:2-amino-4-hydroxy-6-hydroxymethyldihydropteridine diphosphokinase [Gammaproteobacteria bacterium]